MGDTCGTGWIPRRCFISAIRRSFFRASASALAPNLSLSSHRHRHHHRGSHGRHRILIVRPADARWQAKLTSDVSCPEATRKSYEGECESQVRIYCSYRPSNPVLTPPAPSPKRKRPAEAKPVPASGPVRRCVCGRSREVCVDHGQKVSEPVLERTL